MRRKKNHIILRKFEFFFKILKRILLDFTMFETHRIHVFDSLRWIREFAVRAFDRRRNELLFLWKLKRLMEIVSFFLLDVFGRCKRKKWCFFLAWICAIWRASRMMRLLRAGYLYLLRKWRWIRNLNRSVYIYPSLLSNYLFKDSLFFNLLSSL